jgi:hypothetical protein
VGNRPMIICLSSEPGLRPRSLSPKTNRDQNGDRFCRRSEFFAAVDKRLEKMEDRFAKSLDELTKTLDHFLKRMTDMEDKFTFMKEDLKRAKVEGTWGNLSARV